VTKTDELVSLVGREAVISDEDALRSKSHDLSPRALMAWRAGDMTAVADCLVQPSSTDEVGAVLRWADETRTPVVPFGAGSGVCEGISPAGGILLDLSRMDAVLDVDEKSRLVRVQAGCMGGDLAAHLDRKGLMLGHQPQSIDISTVGGWLATRACGQLSAAYGGIEDAISGFEVVLPGGRVMRRKTVPRRSTGPELAGLILGSEGTLGVVTEASLRVAPVPENRTDACVSFAHMADGVAACRSLAQSDLHPTLVRLYDKEDAFILLRYLTDPPGGPVLLLSFDGFAAEARAEAALRFAAGTPQDPAIVEHWWEHRNDASTEYVKVMTEDRLLGPHAVVDTMEVAGTWSALRDLYHSIKTQLSERADIAACHLSHIYPDGACLYFTLASSCESDADANEVLDSWWEIGMRACLDADGSISHHHGIGRAKAAWLSEEMGEWYELLRKVKEVFDPNGIMNPGALGI
jgi:alkyldihydroxyacetonephosphate synthase